MSTAVDEVALSEVERIKLESRGLRGTLAAELASEASHLTDQADRILKFHGSYQQDDRDQRRELKRAGLEPAYSFMVRSKLPGGVLTAEQYLAHDELANTADGTLRITTRQGFQLHGVLKGNLRASIRRLNESLVTTFGACGDVVRNVVSCPAPLPGGLRDEVIAWAQRLSDATLPRTRAYHEIWVEGAQVTRDEAEPDALYGTQYLPRKFKVSFAFPDDNCTDVLSNDLGFVVIAENGTLAGFNVMVGGGLGTTHGKAETFPRLADPLGFVTPDRLVAVTEAVIAVQRDYGNRVNRRRARLKYLLDERGADWMRVQVEQRLGSALAPVVPVRITGCDDHLGWHEQADGRWFRGIWVENGRVRDGDDIRLRTALRTIVEQYRPGVRLTAQHNVLLTDIDAADRAAIDGILTTHGVEAIDGLTPVRRYAMACPALPTCPLAVAESERVFPGIIRELEVAFAEVGVPSHALTVRMTGCPNGCARPYTADIAFVGRSLGKYVVHIGGNPEGTRLAEPYADLVKLEDLVPTVRPLLERYRAEALTGERFGDFWSRVGITPIVRPARSAS
ncbi:MAG: NADPH-dependent assimilatory sulfite reductase hemoprotein subunit [Gemmatimonadota bacterium]